MKSFEFWRRKQKWDCRLVLWHTYFPWRFVEGPADAWDNRTNLFEKQVEAITKNYTPDEPILLADDSFVFHDDLDLEPFIERAMRPGSGTVLANNAWILNPTTQRLLGDIDADPNGERFEKDWNEADFRNWIDRTTWIYAKTYAEKAPHEYAVLGKSDTELCDLYAATMFIMRNGFVQMFYKTPFLAYEVGRRRYWSYISYGLVNRTLEGDLKTYQ